MKMFVHKALDSLIAEMEQKNAHKETKHGCGK